MTDESAAAVEPVADTAAPSAEVNGAGDDAQLSAIFDKLESDSGADVETEEPPEGEETGVGPEGEAPEGGAPPAAEVPLPSNWRGLEDTWAKVPAELRGNIAAHEARLHRTLSEQGQQIAEARPVIDVLIEHADYFDGSVKDQAGNPVTPEAGIRYLFGMQRSMDANPVRTLLQIADNYGVRNEVIAVLSGQADPAQFQRTQAQQRQAGLSPAQTEALVQQAVEKHSTEKEVSDTIGRFAKGKPLYAHVESSLHVFIPLAQQKLGSAASHEAVLESAYDMAVNANPDLRGKAAAPKGAALDPRRAEAAARANAVNVTSTSSGKSRPLTEDELMGEIYDRRKKA